jgi:hypothetical protein
MVGKYMAVKLVPLLLIFLLLFSNTGCVKNEGGAPVTFVMPAIKSGETAKYITAEEISDWQPYNESFQIIGCKTVKDCFGVEHNGIQIGYNNSNRPLNQTMYNAPTNIYIDATTGDVIQVNATTMLSGELVGQISYPADLNLLSLPSMLKLYSIRGIEMHQNSVLCLTWSSTNVSWVFTGSEGPYSVLMAKYQISTSMANLNVKEKYWMNSQEFFPVKVSVSYAGYLMDKSVNSSFSDTIIANRTGHSQGGSQMACVCNSSHTITQHPLAEFQRFNRYPADGSNTEISFPLSSAVLEACNRSAAFETYLQKYPEAYLYLGIYLVKDLISDTNILIIGPAKENVSWNLTFVDPSSKVAYSISVYRETYANIQLLSITSIHDVGEWVADASISIPEGSQVPTDALSVQNAVNIAKAATVLPQAPRYLVAIAWFAVGDPKAWGYLVAYDETEPNGDVFSSATPYITQVLIAQASGALNTWIRGRTLQTINV